MSSRDRIIARALALPQMPMPVTRVLSFLGDESAEPAELVRIIEYDPGLTVNVLRLVNSPYFMGVDSVSSVREAVKRLGMNRIFQLVLASGVAKHVKGEVRGYGLAPGALLTHSVAVAMASEQLGRELDLAVPAHVFSSGLLVNIGKTVLGEFLEVDGEPVLKLAFEEQLSFEEAEERVLGINHAELGALLLAHWQLPEPIVRVVRYKTWPEDCPEHDLALDLVHAGDMVTRCTGLGLGVDGQHYRVSGQALTRVGVTREAVEETARFVVQGVAEVRDLLVP